MKVTESKEIKIIYLSFYLQCVWTIPCTGVILAMAVVDLLSE